MSTKENNKKINVEDGDLEQEVREEQTTPDPTDVENTAEDDGQTEEEQKSVQDEAETEQEPDLQAQIDELKDQYLRKVAEFDNYRKRTLKEKAELILNGGEKTILAILPVLDDFERAIKDESDDPKAIKEGVGNIYKKFVETLEKLGVKKIETEGRDFSTDDMEAIALVPGMGDDKKGKVIDCTETGYMLNDKVIRHAKVAVGQ